MLIASVGEALPEIIHSIPKDSDSRLYGVEACRRKRERRRRRRSSGGRVLGRDTKKDLPLFNDQIQVIPPQAEMWCVCV